LRHLERFGAIGVELGAVSLFPLVRFGAGALGGGEILGDPPIALIDRRFDLRQHPRPTTR
jgi:hypothetical protein